VGELDLPDLRLVTFSPTRGEYVVHDIVMPKLTVVPGREGDVAVESYGTAASEVAEPVAIDVRPVYGWGRATAPSLRYVLPPALAVAASPGLLALAGLGIQEWSARRRRRREATRAPPTALDALRSLPSDPAERLVAYDTALRRLEAQAKDDALREELRALRARLGRVRFGDGRPDPELEADLRDLAKRAASRGKP
jgi:hypothetical protein